MWRTEGRETRCTCNDSFRPNFKQIQFEIEIDRGLVHTQVGVFKSTVFPENSFYDQDFQKTPFYCLVIQKKSVFLACRFCLTSCFNATLSPKLTVHKCQASFNLSSKTFYMYLDKCTSIPQYSRTRGVRWHYKRDFIVTPYVWLFKKIATYVWTRPELKAVCQSEVAESWER